MDAVVVDLDRVEGVHGPRDLDVILQRLEPASASDQFDLILATNILIYYDLFEQSLAVANIAKMLRPGGVFLSNDPISELPTSPISSIGSTDVNETAEGAEPKPIVAVDPDLERLLAEEEEIERRTRGEHHETPHFPKDG